MITVRAARPHRNAYGEKIEKAFNDTYDVPDGHDVPLIAARLVVLDKGKPLPAPGAKPAKPNAAAAKGVKTVSTKAPAPETVPPAANDADAIQG